MAIDKLDFDTSVPFTENDTVGSYLVDGAGALLDKENDTASGGSDRGLGMLAVRKDSATALADTDGDYSFLQVDSSGALRVNASVNVDSNSDKDEDSAHSSGDTGEYMLSVRMSDITVDNSAILAGTNGDYQSVFTNDKGEMYVKDTDVDALLTTIDSVLDTIKVDTAAMVVDLAAIEVEQLAQGVTLDSIDTDTTTIAGDTTSIDATLTALSKAEDSVHVSGDQGIMSLAVRNDAGTPLAADQDYIPFTTDATGALRVTTTASSTTPTTMLVSQKTATSSSTALLGANLASRQSIIIENLGSRAVYLKEAAVTTGTGYRISKGSTLEIKADATIDMFVITPAGTADLRILELA